MTILLLICPIYNEAERVEKLIESLRFQTFQDWEIVFGDNKSQDSSESIISLASSLDSRIHLVSFEEHLPVTENFIRIFDVATRLISTNYIGFVGGDDYFFNDDYFENMTMELNAGKVMAIPSIVSCAEPLSVSRLNTKSSSIENQNLLCADWSYVNAIYSVFESDLLKELMEDKFSRPNAKLGFDWWFVYRAFALSKSQVIYVEKSLYYKFQKERTPAQVMQLRGPRILQLLRHQLIPRDFARLSQKILLEFRWKGFLLKFIFMNLRKFIGIGPKAFCRVVFLLVVSKRPKDA